MPALNLGKALQYAKLAANTHTKLTAGAPAPAAPAPAAPAPVAAPAPAPVAARAPTMGSYRMPKPAGGSNIFLIAGVVCVLLMLIAVAAYVYKQSSTDSDE